VDRYYFDVFWRNRRDNPAPIKVCEKFDGAIVEFPGRILGTVYLIILTISYCERNDRDRKREEMDN
jgi:hypothetical protein